MKRKQILVIMVYLVPTITLLACSDKSNDVYEVGIDSTWTVPSQICDLPDPWPVPADTHWVGNGSDTSCTEDSLRQAVANGGYVRFNCGLDHVTIRIREQIEIRRFTVIDGEGKITLDGGESTRILDVNSELSLRNLRLKNGNAKGETNGGAVQGAWRSKVEVIGCEFEDNVASDAGGAISVWTGSTLTVVSSRFMRNKSNYGGAIYSLWSPLTVINSEFIENVTHVNHGGGAIGTDGALDPDYREDETVGGDIVICGSQFLRNKAWGAGGAAFLWVYPPDRILIDRTLVQDNILEKENNTIAMGGGMRVSNGEITIKSTSFISNSAGTHGGGLSLDCEPTCTITNTTFYNNQVLDGYGGAIFGDKLRVNNVTFANNFASGHGGALFGGSDWILRNSLFVNNEAGNPWGQSYSCHSTGTGDHVLQWVSEFNGRGSDPCIAEVIVSDPLLTEIGNYGGPTPTLLLSNNSPALQAGQGCDPVDQRGEPRDTASCDLGAIELSLDQ